MAAIIFLNSGGRTEHAGVSWSSIAISRIDTEKGEREAHTCVIAWLRRYHGVPGLQASRRFARERLLNSIEQSDAVTVHLRGCSGMSPTKNHILILLSTSEKTSFGKDDFASQSLPQKVFSALWEVESEVNNGGFSQYFLNATSESASFVVEALEILGAPKTAHICKRAIDTAFPDGLPQSVEAIRSAAERFPDGVLAALEPLDEEFFAYPDNLTNLLFAYVSQHPEEFGPLPQPDDA